MIVVERSQNMLTWPIVSPRLAVDRLRTFR